MNGLLGAVGITKSFSGIRALDDVTLRVDEGERVGLIGPNGAVKTTLFDVISGKTPPTTGKVTFADRNITNWPESQIARLGVGRKF